MGKSKCDSNHQATREAANITADKWVRPGHPVFIVSDDLTGAADCAWYFYGETSPVKIGIELTKPQESSSEYAVQVFDLETRSLEPSQSKRRVKTTLANIKERFDDSFFLFKKIDSTLRGNVGVEIDAILSSCDKYRLALVSPAFPAEGRTMVGGRLWVDGVELQQTPVSNDPSSKVTTSDVRRLMEEQSGRKVYYVSRDSVQQENLSVELESLADAIVIVDAATEEELSQIAEYLIQNSDVLPVGSAGMAQQLASGLKAREPFIHVFSDSVTKEKQKVVLDNIGIVVGSAHPVSHRQLQYLLQKKEGLHHLELSTADIETSKMVGEDYKTFLNSHFHIHQSILTLSLTTERGKELPGSQYVSTLAELLKRWLQFHDFQSSDKTIGIVCTGGDTAVAVCKALGVSTLEPQRELSTGVVWSKAASDVLKKDIIITTKAGGFGDEAVLYRVLESLQAGIDM